MLTALFVLWLVIGLVCLAAMFDGESGSDALFCFGVASILMAIASM